MCNNITHIWVYDLENEESTGLFNILILYIWGFLAGAGLPILSSLALGQIYDTEAQRLYSFYNNAFVLGLIGVILLITTIAALHPAIRGLIKISIHNPRSFLPKSPILMIILSFIVFLSLYLGFVFLSPQQSVLQIGVPFIEQTALEQAGLQTTTLRNFGRLLFSIEPASMLETLFAYSFGVIGVIVFNGKIIRLITKTDPPEFIDEVIFVIIFTIIGVILHLARYGASEVTIFTGILPFWFLSGLFIVLVQSVIPAIVFHEVNNGVSSALQIYGADLVTIGILISIAVLIGLGILYYFANKQKGELYEKPIAFGR